VMSPSGYSTPIAR